MTTDPFEGLRAQDGINGILDKMAGERNCKERLEAYLRENGVAFRLHHHPRVYTAQEVAATEHVPGRMLVKTVMVRTDHRAEGDAESKMAMLAMPAPYLADLERAAEALGVPRVRLAHEEEFEAAFPDCEVGAMPPFGNLYGVPVLVDEALAEDETIVFRAGTHTDTMTIDYADFERLVSPTVVAISHRT